MPKLPSIEFCDTFSWRCADDFTEVVALARAIPDVPPKVCVIPAVLLVVVALDGVNTVAVTRPVTFVNEIDPPGSVNAVLTADITLDTGSAIYN